MRKALGLTLTLVLAFVLVLSGCGQKTPAGSATPGAATTTPAATAGGSTAGKDIKLGMVTDVGGVNDKSFNQSAWEGLERVKKDTGAADKYLESHSDADYIPNLNKFVKDGYNLTWGIGFNMGEALKTVASQNPNSKLAIIDNVVEGANVESVTFAENEGSFLVGVVAGLTTKTNKIGFVGGMKIPVITRFEKGFVAGVAAVNPNAKVEINYTGAFDKPDLGKAAAATLYNNGADIIFPAAGSTGNGVFNEAKDRLKTKKVWVIGVDKDQSLEFGNEVTLTSMMKRVDEAVYLISKQVIDGTFKGGTTITLGLKDNGVGLPDTSKINVSPEILKKVDEYKAKIISGEIKVPQE
jgi:basic membrane protein A and related proteins